MSVSILMHVQSGIYAQYQIYNRMIMISIPGPAILSLVMADAHSLHLGGQIG